MVVPPDDDQAYATWSIRNMDIADCLNGILCGTYGTETLEALTVENCKFVDVDTTSAILACVFLSAAGSSSIRTLRVSGISTRNCQYQGVHVSTGATATMGPRSASMTARPTTGARLVQGPIPGSGAVVQGPSAPSPLWTSKLMATAMAGPS